MNLSLLSGWRKIFFSCFLRNKIAEKRARSKQSEQTLSLTLLLEENAVNRRLSKNFCHWNISLLKG
jgi:hypothetical protein